jgi:hypothetical protein
MPQPVSSKLFTAAVRCVVFAFPLLSGCIHLEQTIHLRSNGSATVQYHYSVAEETVDTLARGHRVIAGRQQGMAGGAGDGLDWFTDEQAVRAHFAGANLDVRRYRSYRRGGRLHVELEVFAEDAVRAINDGRFGGWVIAQGPGKTAELRSSLPAPPEAGALSRETVDRVQALCEDLWLRLTVITPADIVDTTGELAGTRRAVWTFAPGEDRSVIEKSPVVTVRFSRDSLSWELPAAPASASQP